MFFSIIEEFTLWNAVYRLNGCFRANVVITRTCANWRPSEGKVKASVGVHLAACRALYEALDWCNVCKEDPFKHARPVPDSRSPLLKGKPYSLDEIEQLLAVADVEGAVVVTLGADCGLRQRLPG